MVLISLASRPSDHNSLGFVAFVDRNKLTLNKSRGSLAAQTISHYRIIEKLGSLPTAFSGHVDVAFGIRHSVAGH